jgi:hypothetical protein
MLQGLFRRRPSAALVVSMLALFVALSGWGYAATGTFVLGKTNRAKKTTGLASTTKRAPAFAVTNTGGATAASFSVKPGVTPFTVNSSVKVAKLNADLLDGVDSSGLQSRITGTCAAGSAIRVVNAEGKVTCEPVGGGGGGTPTNAFWGLKGNSGTTPGTNFLGTTDAKALVIKTNNAEALRVDTAGNVGIGTSGPIARLEAAAATAGIGVLGTSNARGLVGRLGQISCPGTYAVGGCTPDASTAISGHSVTGRGVDGESTSGIGVIGNSSTRGVVGTLGGTSCAGTYAVGGCGSMVGAGVLGDSSTKGVVGTLGGTTCVGPDAVGVWGCGSTVGTGVFGGSSTRGVVGTLGGTSCVGTYAVGGCGATIGDGLLGMTSVGPNSITAAAVHAINTAGGDIFLGQNGGTRVARIDGTGKGFFNGGTQTGGADYAESMRAAPSSALEPGDVLAVDPEHGGTVAKSHRPNSTLVAGVYSTRPALLAVGKHRLGDSLAGEVPVALLGVVPTKVSAENGAVHAGDLLTTASTPGYAMRAPRIVVGGVAIYPTGAVLGKALEPLAHGKGLIRVLVMLR